MTKHGVKVGIVGGGAIAELFHLPALTQNGKTRDSVWLAEPNNERREFLQSKFNLRGAAETYDEIIDKVDAFIVATPPATHYAICKELLDRGKHVLCEKPLTENYLQALDLKEIAAAKKVKLAVNQTRRFFPTYQKIRSLIQDEELGDLQSITYHEGIEFDWPAAGKHHFEPNAKGAWSDTGVHLLDTVCFWLDAQPELVSVHDDGFGGPEALVTVRMRHQSCDIELKISRLGKLPNSFEIVGTKGRITSDVENFTKVKVDSHSGSKTHKCSKPLQYLDLSHVVLNDFLNAILQKETPLANASSTIGVIELLEKAYDQAQRYDMPWNGAIASQVFVRGAETTKPSKVLVTGASGFLGGRIVECMQQAGVVEPVAGLRRWTRAARSARFGGEIRLCNLEDKSELADALTGVDSVVHCAKTDDRDSIVEGTRNLLQESKARGVNKFVFLSTAEVYGPDSQGDIEETQSLEPTGRIYGDSKLEAEQVCLEFAEQGIDVKILRPSIIYGPFSVSWSIDMAKRLLSGKWGTFGKHGEGYANLVYVDDLVQAIWLCLIQETEQRVFNINGPETPTWNQYFDCFNNALSLPQLRSIEEGKSSLKTKVMDTVDYLSDKVLERFEDQLMEIYLRGGFLGRMMKRLKGELDSTPSGNELHDLFSRKARYVDSLARAQLGYVPQVSLGEGLARTTDWLRLHEIIPASSEGNAS